MPHHPLTFLLAALVALAGPALAGPHDITYQGELRQSGVPASGSFEFEFELFDAPAGGGSRSAVLQRTLAVSEGIFTAVLDFGSAPFDGAATWLEVRVRPAGSGPYTPLAPRQAVTAAPYALHAQSVAVGAVGSSAIADGSIAAADVDTGQIQLRLDGSCGPGSAIRAVDHEGTLTCEATGDADWTPVGDGRIESQAGVRIQTDAATTFPFTVRHDSSIASAHASLTETTPSDFARLSFYNDATLGRFWTIAARVHQSGVSNDTINFYNSGANGGAGADILTIDGDRRVGINMPNPLQALHVGGEVRIEGLAHANPAPRPVLVDGTGDLSVQGDPPVRHLTLLPTAFQIDRSGEDFGTNTFHAFVTTPGGGFVSAVLLPEGARIHRITATVLDNTSASSLIVRLLRVSVDPPFTAIVQASFQTTVESANPQVLSAELDPPMVIDNVNYGYNADVLTTLGWPADSYNVLKLHNVIIEYTEGS